VRNDVVIEMPFLCLRLNRACFNLKPAAANESQWATSVFCRHRAP
jgi:hypothetical protein